MSPETVSGVDIGKTSKIFSKSGTLHRYWLSSGGLYIVRRTKSFLLRVTKQAKQRLGKSLSSCFEPRVFFTSIKEHP